MSVDLKHDCIHAKVHKYIQCNLMMTISVMIILQPYTVEKALLDLPQELLHLDLIGGFLCDNDSRIY